MSEITALKQKRGHMKAKITRLQKHYDDLDRENLSETDILQLGLRLSKFENVLEEFEKIQLEIEILEPNSNDEERNKFENEYFELITKIHSLIKSHESNNRSLSHDAFSNSTTNVNNIAIKLPTIKLPHFKGTFDKWLEFRDAFKSMVHNNTSIGKSEKFYYLKSSLSDEALRVIESIEVTDGNYEIAWNLLEDRYENKPLIVHTHIKSIFEVKAVTKESHIELRRLIDDVSKHLRALEALQLPVKEWDTLLIYIISGKLDAVTRREWEAFDIQSELPNMTDMKNFLKQKCNVLEKIEQNNQAIKCTTKTKSFQSHVNIERDNLKCYFCKNSHSIYNCKALLKLNINARIREIKARHLCTNCLRPGHTDQVCKLSGCRKCDKRHNSLLHYENNEDNNAGDIDSPDESSPKQAISCHIKNTGGQVLLSTAMIEIKDANGQFLSVRALLDSGSQSNFITTRLCQRLGLARSKVNFSVQGVGQCLSNIEYCTKICLTSNVNKYKANISCLVIPMITGELPMNSLEAMELNIPKNIRLADPKFYEQGQVDVLLGAGIFWELLCVGQICLGNGLPILQKTQLGWIVAGNVSYQSRFNKTFSGHSMTKASESNLENELKKFWQLEECSNGKAKLSKDEQYCEDHFARTHRRNEEGRFIVELPLRDNVAGLGDSRQLALERFYSLERKLGKNRNLKLEYLNVMQEYSELGHMSPIKEEDENQLNVTYYLPHHAVVKESSLTTKVRVVFDASMKSTSGLSLNDIQYVGPVIQNDLISIILRFRKHQYVVTADISKMYRQVLVSEQQRSLQRIFWRPDPGEELQCFQLNTVSYGTGSTPYLATKCLDQLATECETTKPKASSIIKNDFYVDDLLTGSNSIEELLEIQRDVTSILTHAGFELRKWVSNDERVMNELQVNRNLETSVFPLGDNPRSKTLGILWNAKTDCIEFATQAANETLITKRTILSKIAQVFDPLGLLGPIIIIIIAKVIIQRLWQGKLSWDEAVPQSIYAEWTQFIDNLPKLNNIKIPRWVCEEYCVSTELHGSSDASEIAYGACIYIRCENVLGEVKTSLLCAKSRVAPLKRVTLPRLELCAAQLLAHLVQKVNNSLQMTFDRHYYWCDSTITLSWIKAPPNKWKTFVANRVSDIQDVTNPQDWNHVKSEDNPADLLSRGLGAEHIQNCTLWWKGPTWLEQRKALWNTIEIKTSDDIQIPERLVTGLALETIRRFELFERYSDITTLNRTWAYMLRFIHNCKSGKEHRRLGILTASELKSSLHLLIKFAQRETYPDEYDSLVNKRVIKKRSHLLSLNPFVDDESLLRVNGRIQNARQDLINTQPIILPNGHILTKLILIKKHNQLLHCGPQQLLYAVRELYWPIAGRSLARSIVHKCIKCFRAKPMAQEYKMGNLPAVRVNQYAPFLNTGIDYAGPFVIKDRKTRAPKMIKAYICLFICLSTKAVHLELVTDLTTQAFLSTLKRFMSRRGKPASIYSDNGTTFVGANAHLKELFSFLKSKSSETIINALANDNITWHFIPPRAPSFGGLWEAGIKSIKYHLKRVLGNASLDYEGFCTALTQIEAVLNSRPLSPLSSDPSDNNPLTPAHFLIGRALVAVSEPFVMHIKESRLSKYQKFQKILEHFWQRWHKEYISELQTRIKWKQSLPEKLKIGSLVVVKEDNQPPLCWALGRITILHPGKDNITRVVTIRTATSTIKRPVHKICVLPIDN